jgi:hypothetical protein
MDPTCIIFCVGSTPNIQISQKKLEIFLNNKKTITIIGDDSPKSRGKKFQIYTWTF